MNIKARIKNFYKKNGKKMLIIFLVYFVAKWTLTIIFGAKLINIVKNIF